MLGRYVREHQVISLREAVRRMTSLAAVQFNIPLRGIIRDVVPFLVVLVVALLAMILIPDIVLFLPRLLGYEG